MGKDYYQQLLTLEQKEFDFVFIGLIFIYIKTCDFKIQFFKHLYPFQDKVKRKIKIILTNF